MCRKKNRHPLGAEACSNVYSFIYESQKKQAFLSYMQILLLLCFYKNTETMLFGIASAINTEGKKTTVNG